MRILLIATIIFTLIHFIRVDLVEGTIPSKPYVEEAKTCEEETFSITVTSIDNDTIQSLFALYPDPEITLLDRLTKFYALNPHLQKQEIVSGEKIKLPISSVQASNCVE
ncbi:hypothetical protein [Sporosarcina jiandibaonis]|uniref:hypothetical protein n=1 Tax=Sporosarcina jiandibaonis TaxID=2715535 RepID=UPI0015532265|nr:hypothetical protein [Sporosarcina jiandibaonis]